LIVMLRLLAVSSLFVVTMAACTINVAPPSGNNNSAGNNDGDNADNADNGDNGDNGSSTPPPSSGPRHFTVQLQNVAPWMVAKSGVVDVPVGHTTAGPLHAGDAYEVTFTAGRIHRVSFALMLGASNDWFYASPDDGIALYDESGVPLSQDVTSMVQLYDAGTEIDEEPGVGPDTGPRQATPTDGAPDPIGLVRAVASPALLSDGSSFVLPDPSAVVHVTLTPIGERTFKLRIENVSGAGALSTSEGQKDIALSPSVWTVHGSAHPLFTVGEPDRGDGLEELAESGRAQKLGDALAATSGVATGFSPGVFVVHSAGEPLFTVGQPDRGLGLEQLAESGNASALDDGLGTAFPDAATLKAVFNTVDGSTGPGPLRPGDTYTIELDARPGDRLSFASMFGASNDWIVATPAKGIALFDDAGTPAAGDHTADLGFFDVGTELNEELGIGADTGPNQLSPDQGAADRTDVVRPLSPVDYPFPVAAHLTMTIGVAAL
jgi:hypothetical protein